MKSPRATRQRTIVFWHRLAGSDREPITKKSAPAFVSESVERLIVIENEALQPRSRSEAITGAIAGFVGTVSFVFLQIGGFAAWVILTPGRRVRSLPLLSSIASLEAFLIAAFVLMRQNRMGVIGDRRDSRPSSGKRGDRMAGDQDYSDAR